MACYARKTRTLYIGIMYTLMEYRFCREMLYKVYYLIPRKFKKFQIYMKSIQVHAKVKTLTLFHFCIHIINN